MHHVSDYSTRLTEYPCCCRSAPPKCWRQVKPLYGPSGKAAAKLKRICAARGPSAGRQTGAGGQIGGSGPRRRGCGSDPGRWRKQLLNERISNGVTRSGFFLSFFPPSSWSWEKKEKPKLWCRRLLSTSRRFEVWNLLVDAAQLWAAQLSSLFLAPFSTMTPRRSYFFPPCCFFFPLFLSQQVWPHTEISRQSSQMWEKSKT